MIEWSVSPEIFSIGPVTIRWYSVLFAASFFIGFELMKRIFIAEKQDLDHLDKLLIVMMVSTVVGARLGHCLFYDPAYYLSNPLEILKIWEGGLASHGAAIGILAGLFWYSSRTPSQSFWWVVDRVTITVALAGFFIRLGNFFNSEILGRPTDSNWGIVFTAIDDLPRHPVQLYEAVAYLGTFLFLFNLYWKKGAGKLEGLISGWFFVLIFSSRFFLEMFKTKQEAFDIAIPLSMGQILSVPFALAGVYLIWKTMGQPSDRS